MSKSNRRSASGTPCSILLLTLSVLTLSCSSKQRPTSLYQVGEAVELDGWRVQVLSFSRLSSDEAFRPAPGDTLCSVELAIENRTDVIRFMMPERQMLLTCDGTTYSLDQDASVMSARSRSWMVPEGEIRPGVIIHGAASYQIPAEVEDVNWIFQSALFPWSPRVTFALGRPS